MSSVLGARWLGEGRTRFLVWAPYASSVEVVLEETGGGPGGAPAGPRAAGRAIPLEPLRHGYHGVIAREVEPGALYRYRLDGGDSLPDPASRSQPQGVHGPSEVVDPGFDWTDGGWRGIPLDRYVLYEIHVGTFTPEGTFDAVIPRLDDLAGLGVTAIELMPVSQFPGRRNWGYDGVYPFAAQDSYGGPTGLRRLVDACHARGLAVVLDVVLNHMGPEGNYLARYGPYFTDKYRTPWGDALNFDGAGSDEVRRFFVESAVSWITDYHLDGLRLDAVHAIFDQSPLHILEQVGAAVHTAGDRQERRVVLMPESDANDPRLVERRDRGGYGLDAVWTDDFHHALHAMLTDERQGYYQDFDSLETLEWAFAEGFVYAGQLSRYRGRRHGRSARDLPAERHVVFAQNHDQIGNRAGSERLSALVDFESLKLAAAAYLLSPYLPLLFMGEEWGETAPFPYFVDHGDRRLNEAVRNGRRAEFAAFDWWGEIPDPAASATFEMAQVAWGAWRGEDPSARRAATLRDWYEELLRLRRDEPALAHHSKDGIETAIVEEDLLVVVRRPAAGDGVPGDCVSADGAPADGAPSSDAAALLLHFGPEPVETSVAIPAGSWRKRIDSAAERWDGPGSRTPDRVPSDGQATVELAPRSALLLVGGSGS